MGANEAALTAAKKAAEEAAAKKAAEEAAALKAAEEAAALKAAEEVAAKKAAEEAAAQKAAAEAAAQKAAEEAAAKKAAEEAAPAAQEAAGEASSEEKKGTLMLFKRKKMQLTTKATSSAPPEVAPTEETMSCTDEDSATALVDTASTRSEPSVALSAWGPSSVDVRAVDDELPSLSELPGYPALHAAGPKRAPVAAPRPQLIARPAPRARGAAQGGKHEREVLDILVSQVSALIGRGGRTVRAIEEMTGAKVSMKNAKAEDKQPQVVILGRKDAVAKAKELVLAKLPIVGRLEILESEVGAVKGQKGKRIQELEQRTGATISVAPVGQYRDVVISGPSQWSVDAAIDEIGGVLAARRRV